MKESGTHFYLTGGTALSRYYLNHRYSDDLDLFLNRDSNYPEYVDVLIKGLRGLEDKNQFAIDEKRIFKTVNYCRLFLYGDFQNVRMN